MLSACRPSLLKARATIVPTARFISLTRVCRNEEDATKSQKQFEAILSALKRNQEAFAAEKQQATDEKAGSGRPVDNVANALNESVRKDREQRWTSPFKVDQISQELNFINLEMHQIHINATPNNTIITLTRPNGSPLICTSGGTAGFKKAARSGYEAGHQAAMQLLEKKQAKNLQVKNVHIILKGFGAGREAAFKALVSGEGWNVKRITDATPIPFGGCRPKKARRL